MRNIVRIGIINARNSDGYVLMGENDNGIQAELGGWFSSYDEAEEYVRESYESEPEDWRSEDEDA